MRVAVRSVWLSMMMAALWVVPAAVEAQTGAPQRGKKLTNLETIQLAHTLFVQSDYEGARKYYLQVLPAYPDSFDLLKNLAYCYYRMGPRGLPQAARYYAQAYKINPSSREVVENLSKCYLELKRYSEAAAIFRKMAEARDAPPEIWKKLAAAYDAARRIPEAEAAYDAYLQRSPGDLEARSNLGRLYSWEKAYGKALEQFRIVLSSNPNYPPALIGMARVLSWQGRSQESLELYNRVLRLDPKNSEAESGKAFVLLWMRRPEEAQTLFRKLHQRYPRDAELAKGLKDAEAAVEAKVFGQARQRGDTATLEAYYLQRLSKDPNDLTALTALAEFSADPKRCAEGIEYGRRAKELAPQDDKLELTLARSLAACQQYVEAAVRYRRFLERQPKAEAVLYDLGETLLRARSHAEAIEVFHNLLGLNPKNADATLGLAQAQAATHHYAEALANYEKVLKSSPENDDALQGKAFVLYWTGELAQARTIFQTLADKRPGDPQNSEVLENITRAEEEARWVAMRPAAGAPPQAFTDYYKKRLASYPDDKSALKGVAYMESQLKNVPAAIRAYQRVLEIYPDDLSSKREMARLLGLEGQYEGSINFYREVLKSTPEDTDALEGLARVCVWSKRDQEALTIYQSLVAKNPSNTTYQLEVARLQLRLRDFPAARELLASLLSADPQNYEARLQLARLELIQGERASALKHFESLLKQDPRDFEALFGKAQISYYQRNLREAHAAANALVQERPDNFDAVFLLATIEHARRNRRATLALLDQAEKLSPKNASVLELRNRVLGETRVTIHTSASYAREVGAPGEFVLKDAVPPSLRGQFAQVLGPLERFTPRTGLPNYDLRMYSYGTQIGFSMLPRTASVFSLSYLPSTSPPGPIRDNLGNQLPAGITGASAPAQFFYRQTSRLSPHFTLRVGVGLIRFGPGLIQNLAGQRTGSLKAVTEVFGTDVLPASIRAQLVPGRTAEFNPLGLVSFTVAPSKKFSVDVSASRSAITYTPIAVRLGVMQNRFGGGLNFFFNPRTELHLDYFYGHYTSVRFPHYDLVNFNIIRLLERCVDVPLSQCFLVTGQLTVENRVNRDQAHGGSVDFLVQVFKSEPFSFEAGYEGTAYGFAGPRRDIFMGFFNPSFYQQHLLTARFSGKLAGPLGYDFGGGIGLRQSGQGEAMTRALRVSPSLTFRVSQHFSFGVGFTHYTTAQALGALKGNVVRLTTDWSF